MTPQELKASILQLAMQGKITEQLPTDGSAQDLLGKLHTFSLMAARFCCPLRVSKIISPPLIW